MLDRKGWTVVEYHGRRSLYQQQPSDRCMDRTPADKYDALARRHRDPDDDEVDDFYHDIAFRTSFEWSATVGRRRLVAD